MYEDSQFAKVAVGIGMFFFGSLGVCILFRCRDLLEACFIEVDLDTIMHGNWIPGA